MKSNEKGIKNNITCAGRDLNEEYGDLLLGSSDAKLARLVSDLDAAYGEVEPPAKLVGSLDQIMREHMRAQSLNWGEPRNQHRTERAWHVGHVGQSISSPLKMPNRMPRSRRLPAHLLHFPFLSSLSSSRRAGTAAALVLAVLLLAGAGYAAVPALERLFGVHTGTGAIIAHQLGKEVEISRSIDGFTVTVRRVYADPNQIVIGLTVSGPPNRTFNNIMPWGDYYETPKGTMGESPILTDKEGKEFNGGMGGEQGAVENGTAPYLLTYEGTGLERNSKEIKEISVRLKIGELTAYERTGENAYEDIMVEGPFIFELTVPIEQGRIADLRQTVESSGHSITLERVVTTATGTRLSLRGAGPNADVRLTISGETYTLHPPDGMGVPMQWAADSVWEYVSGASLVDKEGEWELTVRPVRPGPTLPSLSHLDPPPTQLEGGPWTFRFILP